MHSPKPPNKSSLSYQQTKALRVQTRFASLAAVRRAQAVASEDDITSPWRVVHYYCTKLRENTRCLGSLAHWWKFGFRANPFDLSTRNTTSARNADSMSLGFRALQGLGLLLPKDKENFRISHCQITRQPESAKQHSSR